MLTLLTNSFNVVRTNNQIRNETVFYLLELRHLISMPDVRPVKKILFKKVAAHMPDGVMPDEMKPAFAMQVEAMMTKMAKPFLESKFQYLKENFAKTIHRLSAISPILAYELSGRENIIQIGDHVKTQLNDAMTDLNPAETDKIRSYLMDTLNENLVLQSLEIIDELLKKLSLFIVLKRSVKF